MKNTFDDFNVEHIWTDNNDFVSLNPSEYLRLCQLDGAKIQYVYIYQPCKSCIDLEEVKLLTSFLHVIPTDTNGRNILPIYLDLQNVSFSDKLVYVLLETVIYHLVVEKNWIISVQGNIRSENCSNGVRFSSLTQGNLSDSMLCQPNFNDVVEEKKSIRNQYYKYNRKETSDLCLTRSFVRESSDVNIVASNIDYFLRNSSILESVTENNINNISNTIMEMISNCSEHIQSSYAYDIDLKKVVHRVNSNLCGKEYIAINVALWDFSNVRLGDAIKRKVAVLRKLKPSDPKYIEQVGLKEKIYKKLLSAYDNHSSFLDDDYTEDQFFSLAAFQPGITGRKEPGSTGGAGLSHVLDFLCEYPDNYRCYCLTGDIIISLNKKYLSKDADNWYSFGERDGFLTNKPSKQCITKSNFFYPGTAFFLHLELN